MCEEDRKVFTFLLTTGCMPGTRVCTWPQFPWDRECGVQWTSHGGQGSMEGGQMQQQVTNIDTNSHVSFFDFSSNNTLVLSSAAISTAILLAFIVIAYKRVKKYRESFIRDRRQTRLNWSTSPRTTSPSREGEARLHERLKWHVRTFRHRNNKMWIY